MMELNDFVEEGGCEEVFVVEVLLYGVRRRGRLHVACYYMLPSLPSPLPVAPSPFLRLFTSPYRLLVTEYGNMAIKGDSAALKQPILKGGVSLDEASTLGTRYLTSEIPKEAHCFLSLVYLGSLEITSRAAQER